jgi:DNA-binding CsgD family transcriptional regulator
MDLSNDHGLAPSRTLEILSHNGTPHAERGTEAVDLSALWMELVSGSCKIEETLFTEQSCALVVTRGHRSAGRVRALSRRHAEILERSLIEGARKSVAIDLGLCPSSVAEILKQGFGFMGLSCWPSRIPLLLVLAAHAQRARELDRPAAARLAENQRALRQTISVSRPDNDLGARLTPAEFAVTRLLVEGKSYAQMALLRQTSARTVANQLAAAFHRLGVSGRAELMCMLAARKVAAWRISTRTPPFPRPPAEAVLGVPRVAGQGRRRQTEALLSSFAKSG